MSWFVLCLLSALAGPLGELLIAILEVTRVDVALACIGVLTCALSFWAFELGARCFGWCLLVSSGVYLFAGIFWERICARFSL